MGRGAPDYTRITEIKGLSPTATLVTIAVDANGQLYAVVKGQYGSTLLPIAVDSAGRIIMVPYGTTVVSGDVNATPTTTVRQVQGADGATYRTLAVDANGQLIMVPRGQSGNYMAVDSSGFLTTVMKGLDGVTLRTVAVDANGKILGVLQGDYAGSLKTLAVDSQGRMLAVLTDPEDVFGNPHYLGAAELAARLGSIHTFERRGQVIFQDDFEGGDTRWIPHAVVTPGEYYLSSGQSRSGRFSYRIRATGGAGTRQDIDIYRSILPLCKVGLEFSASHDTASSIIQMYLELRGTTKGLYAGLRVDTEAFTLSYLNSAGGWTVFESAAPLYAETSLFTSFKVVADMNTQKYVRAFAADREYDLSTIDAQALAATSQPHILLHLGQLGKATAITAIWLDDVILTQNEP